MSPNQTRRRRGHGHRTGSTATTRTAGSREARSADTAPVAAPAAIRKTLILIVGILVFGLILFAVKFWLVNNLL